MGRYSPTVVPWAAPSAFQMANETVGDTIANIRKKRQEDRENARSDAYLAMAQGQEKRAIQGEHQRSAQEGFFNQDELEARIGLTTPELGLSSTESTPTPEQNLAAGGRGVMQQAPSAGGAIQQVPSVAQSISEVRQQRSTATPPARTSSTWSGQPAGTRSGEAPSGTQLHFQKVGERLYIPGWSEQTFRTYEQESIYDARTREVEARNERDRERDIADIMSAMKVDHATAAGIHSRSLSSTDVQGGRTADNHTDAEGKVWQFNPTTRTWDRAMAGGPGGKQMTGPLPYRGTGSGSGGSALSELGRVVDDTRTAALAARRQVPTDRPANAVPDWMINDEKVVNPTFNRKAAESFVSDSTRLAGIAEKKERIADAALEKEHEAAGITDPGPHDPSDEEPARGEGYSTDLRGRPTGYTNPGEEGVEGEEGDEGEPVDVPKKTVNVARLRQQRDNAIRNGKDPKAAAALFTKLTGLEK